jgi:hypothetical protein
VEIILSRDSLNVVRAKSDSLVQPYGWCVVDLYQERHARVPYLASLIAARFNQLATITVASVTRPHAEGIQIKLRRLWFGGDTIAEVTRLLGSCALKRGIQLSGSGAVIEDSHPDQLSSFFHHQSILIADTIILLFKKVA